MKTTRLSSLAALSALVLGAASTPSAAEEELTWQTWAGQGGASMVYGMAESDYVLLSLACESRGGPVLVFFPYEPKDAKDGATYGLTLQTDTHAVTMKTIGSRMEMDDLFVLEGQLRDGREVGRLFEGSGLLKLGIGKDVTDLPLANAKEPVREFLAVCAP